MASAIVSPNSSSKTRSLFNDESESMVEFNFTTLGHTVFQRIVWTLSLLPYSHTPLSLNTTYPNNTLSSNFEQ
jgi:hypothetical protein